MKFPLLNRQDQERQLNEMWEAINGNPDEDQGRQDAIDQAMETQKRIYQRLDNQEKALQALWDAANIIDSESPLTIALQILANAERLIPILKSYQTVTA